MRPISTTPAESAIAITNFDKEMVALYQTAGGGAYKDIGLPRASDSHRATVWVSAARLPI